MKLNLLLYISIVLLILIFSLYRAKILVPQSRHGSGTVRSQAELSQMAQHTEPTMQAILASLRSTSTSSSSRRTIAKCSFFKKNDSASEKESRSCSSSKDSNFAIQLRQLTAFAYVMRNEEAAAAMSERVSVLEDISGTDAEYWIRSQIGDKKLEDEYLLGDVIGRGNSSVVYRCLRKGRTEWACKILKKRQLNKKSVQAHIKTLLKLKHPNIIHIKEAFETQDEIQLILESAQGGELLERIVERGHYSEEDAAQAVRHILNALQYLHSNGIIHRSLKPENLLYETEMEDALLKLADCGMSKLLSEDHSSITRVCGVFGFCAPEVLLKKNIDSSIDLWSVGVITYIILCGFDPFWNDAGEAEMYRRIIKGNYSFPSPWWDEISDGAKELVSQLLSLDPKCRPTAAEALNHPWILGIFTPTSHMNQTLLRLREFNARRRFRVATKAVLATRRALNLLPPTRKYQSQKDKIVCKCFHEEPKDGRTSESKCNKNLKDKIFCRCCCCLTDGSAGCVSNESLPSLPIVSGDMAKTSTKLAKELSSQYKENYADLG